MAIVYLSLGSNLGNRKSNLETAMGMISDRLGSPAVKSDIYETQAWGYDGQNFLNMVLKTETLLKPRLLLVILKEIERDMGRVQSGDGYTDRNIDIDILFYDDLVIKSENLVIPHPDLVKRLFVLAPLKDLAPELTHPVFKITIYELLELCPDKGWIKRFEA